MVESLEKRIGQATSSSAAAKHDICVRFVEFLCILETSAWLLKWDECESSSVMCPAWSSKSKQAEQPSFHVLPVAMLRMCQCLFSPVGDCMGFSPPRVCCSVSVYTGSGVRFLTGVHIKEGQNLFPASGCWFQCQSLDGKSLKQHLVRSFGLTYTLLLFPSGSLNYKLLQILVHSNAESFMRHTRSWGLKTPLCDSMIPTHVSDLCTVTDSLSRPLARMQMDSCILK